MNVYSLVTRIKSRLLTKEILPILYLGILFSIYLTIWIHIDLGRFHSLNYLVWDFGNSMEKIWLVYNAQWTVFKLLHFLFLTGIVFLVSPLYFTHSYIALIILQPIILGIPVFGIYGIAKHFLKSTWSSLFISSGYLFFFLLSGPNWYVFHFQTFFIPFFIYGYFFFVKGNYKTSYVLLLLSGLTRYPYIIFPLLFSISTIIFDHFEIQERELRHRRMKFLLLPLGITTSVIFAISYYSNGNLSGFAEPFQYTISSSPLISIILSNLSNKMLTVLLTLVPFLCLPLLSKRWVIFLVPFYTLLFYSGGVYAAPPIFFDQYSTAVIPFLFIGTIDVLGKMKESKSVTMIPSISPLQPSSKKSPQDKTVLTFSSVLVVLFLLFGFVYLPYSPVSQFSYASFNPISEYDNPNLPVFNEANRIVSMVPADCSTAVFQNNLPMGYPRPLFFGQSPIPDTSLPYNLSYHNPDGSWHKLVPSYIVIDPTFGDYRQFTNKGPFPDNISMFELVSRSYAHGYGIVAQASGITLFERGYSGQLQYYSPLKTYYSASYFTPFGPSQREGNHIVLSNITNKTIAYTEDVVGPYIDLAPGTYKVTYVLSSSTMTSNDSSILITSANSGGLTLGKSVIGQATFSNENQKTYVSFSVTLNNSYTGIEFRVLDSQWYGILNFFGVYVNETTPPSVTYDG